MSNLVSQSELSAEQQAAVDYPTQPVAVIAGAGTGKTSVMSARVLHLVTSGQVDSEALLGLTFTNKAASELKSRIAKQLGKKYQDTLPTVSTYHSFARQLLIDFGAALGIEPDHRTLTDSSRAQLALEVLQKTQVSIKHLNYTSGRLVEMLMKLDDLLAEHLLNPESLTEFDLNWLSDLSTLSGNEDVRKAITVAQQRIELVEVVKEFRIAKHQLSLVDFADQMRLSVDLLSLADDVVNQLRDRHLCVLLDEYQDTSVAQQRMLQLAFGDGHSVTAVGDPLQSIYAWRGASADTTSSFPFQFRTKAQVPAEVLSLSNNYRSGQKILDAANQVISPVRANQPGSIPLKQGNLNLDLGTVQVGCYQTSKDEVAAIVEQVKSLINEGVKFDDIAILGRTANTLLKVHQALVAAEVPAALIGVETIARTPEVVEILSLMEVAANPLANGAVARLLISPRLNIGDRDLAALAAHSKKLVQDVLADPDLPIGFESLDSLTQSSLADALTDLSNAHLSKEAQIRMSQLNSDIAAVRGAVNALEAVWRAINCLNLDIELYANPTSQITQRSNVVNGFIDLVRRWLDSTDDQSVIAFMSWVNAAKRFSSIPKIDVPLVAGAVSLMTIHRAKGLEWPYVFIPEVTKDVFPTSQGRSVFTTTVDALPHSLRGDNLSLPPDPSADKKSLKDFKSANREYSDLEELRLFYVALTRAQKLVTVTSYWWGDTQKNPRGPSRLYSSLLEAKPTVLADFPAPSDAVQNPFIEEKDVYRVQANQDYREKLNQIAQEVIQTQSIQTPDSLTDQDLNRVNEWDLAINWLTSKQETMAVTLPNLLTTSNLMSAINRPKEYAEQLIRPIPVEPHISSHRGTTVHSKIENYFKQAALIDLDDLLGNPVRVDEFARAAFTAFEKSHYAQLRPTAIEWSFQLPLGKLLISGRVDAVFEIDGQIVLIDWKTGRVKSADQLQLAIYRLAWSEVNQVPMSEIKSKFVFLPDLDEVEADLIVTKEQLIEKLVNSTV